MVNGFITKLNKMLDIAKVALKIRNWNLKQKRKMTIFISCLIAKELANKKIYKFKRLITV